MFNARTVFKVISRHLFIVALSLIVCVGVALIYAEAVWTFIVFFAAAALIGGIFYLLMKQICKGINKGFVRYVCGIIKIFTNYPDLRMRFETK